MAKTAKLASPVNPGAGAKEVLVIKLSALGDFVLALGAMKAVREFPSFRPDHAADDAAFRGFRQPLPVFRPDRDRWPPAHDEGDDRAAEPDPQVKVRHNL
jgi:hypothetical protein